MGHSQSNKAETHSRVVDMAARRFRELGLDGLSIADLMEETGLTHGGFYKHFSSRDALVTEAVDFALSHDVPAVKSEAKNRTLSQTVKAYLDPAHRDDLGGGCALSSLMNDMPRAPNQARALYTSRVRRDVNILERIASPNDDPNRREKAIFTLSVLVGALGLARAVSDKALSDEILAAVRRVLLERSATRLPPTSSRSLRRK